MSVWVEKGGNLYDSIFKNLTQEYPLNLKWADEKSNRLTQALEATNNYNLVQFHNTVISTIIPISLFSDQESNTQKRLK